MHKPTQEPHEEAYLQNSRRPSLAEGLKCRQVLNESGNTFYVANCYGNSDHSLNGSCAEFWCLGVGDVHGRRFPTVVKAREESRQVRRHDGQKVEGAIRAVADSPGRQHQWSTLL